MLFLFILLFYGGRLFLSNNKLDYYWYFTDIDFLAFLFSVLKREYILRKYFQFVLEMQLNVLYVQNHHLLRFQLLYRSCQPRKRLEPLHFLLVLSAVRSLVRIFVLLLLYILFLYHI